MEYPSLKLTVLSVCFTSDEPAYTIVGGNPAKVIKKRFSDESNEIVCESDEIVCELEKLAWWDWPVEEITKHLTAIMSNDIKALSIIAQSELAQSIQPTEE